MISENASLDEIASLFSGDRFATQAAGCRVLEGAKGHAVCELELKDVHRNAMGGVMGGAIFTLADFALAIASNVGEQPTVSVSHSIDFFSSTKGTRLIATARCDKSGKRLGFYTVDIADDLGRSIARMTATCARVGA